MTILNELGSHMHYGKTNLTINSQMIYVYLVLFTLFLLPLPFFTLLPFYFTLLIGLLFLSFACGFRPRKGVACQACLVIAIDN